MIHMPGVLIVKYPIHKLHLPKREKILSCEMPWNACRIQSGQSTIPRHSSIYVRASWCGRRSGLRSGPLSAAHAIRW